MIAESSFFLDTVTDPIARFIQIKKSFQALTIFIVQNNSMLRLSATGLLFFCSFAH